MTDRFNVLTQQLLQKNIDDCSVEELENLAREYPYFAPAQYVLLARLKDSDYNSYQAHLQKAILYYHDPLAFDHFLNAGEYTVDFTVFSPEEIVLHHPNEADEIIEHIAETNPLEKKEIVDVEISSNETIEEPVNETLIQEQVVAVAEETPNYETINETSIGNSVEAETVDEEITSEEIQPAPILKIETGQTDTGLVFEPYYTVDYFASQGIKLSQEEASKDKFGKQLKSFTEWLKTMKRLPVAEQAKKLDSRSEEKVENLAAHSVEGAEVYTETMAEVWAQQGNNEKAMEVYNKLSLLNPSKRAYFAAKIDSLK